MHPAGNMAAPYRGGNTNIGKAPLATSRAAKATNRGAVAAGLGAAATSKGAVATSRDGTKTAIGYTYTNRGAAATSKGAVASSRGRTTTGIGYTASSRGAVATGTTSRGTSGGLAQPSKSHQAQRSAPIIQTPIYQTVGRSHFILLVDKEVQGKAADSILTQRHTPSSKKILRGSLLQGYEMIHNDGGPRTRSAARKEGKHFIVKPLSGDMQFECDSSEIARITFNEMELLMALSMDSLRLQTYKDKDLLPYALSLNRDSLVKVQHRSDNTSLHEEADAVVRYIGALAGTQMGTYFGLEFIDEKHKGQGSSDGEFGKTRYFQTEHDCAVFVPINKLIPRPSPIMYESVQGFRQEKPNQPEELTSFGEIRKGMTVNFQVGSSWKSGKVVYMTVPPQQSEAYIAVEMPKTSDDHHQTWNGYFDKQYLYTPKEDAYTHFIPANSVIPEHLMKFPEEKHPEEVTNEQVTISAPKEKNKGKKSSEPFFFTNNKSRRSSSPYASSEKLDKGGHKTRHDVSDSVFNEKKEVRRDVPDELPYLSGHFSEENKPSFVEIMKGKIDKVKSKFNNGSKGDESSKPSWYADSYISTEAAREGFSETKQMLGEADYLEDDVVEEVINIIYKDWRTIGHSLYLSKDEIEHITKKGSTEKERTMQMLRAWQKRGTGYDKISRLAEACRTCGFNHLANELEQGLDEDVMMKIACSISQEKFRPFGLFLHFSHAELDKIEHDIVGPVPRTRLMLAKWRTRQSHNSDKIMLLSNALHDCGLRQLELEVARGLDDEIMLSFAIQIGYNWKILATTLRLEVKDIQHLQDFSEDKQPYQMLMMWRRKQHRNVDVLGTLSKGLRESGLPGLANDLVQGVDDEMLYRLATLIGDAWESVALHLGFSDEELTALKKDKMSETNTIINMLNKWRERHDYTYHRFEFLMTALKTCDLKMIADSFERDRHQRTQAMKEDAIAETKTYIGDAKNKDLVQQDVSREVLVKVSKEIAFKDLSSAMNAPTEDVIGIENYYKNNDQRCFQLLDSWKRRGVEGKRSICELFQILARVEGTSALMDDIMRTEGTAADKKEDDQRIKEFPTDFNIHLPPLDEVPLDALPLDEPLSPDLEVNSMVEVTTGMPGTAKRYGVIQWIGVPEGSKSDNLVAGVELESPIAQGATDGTFNKQRYFQCGPNKAIFVYLLRCRSDSRFPSQSQTFRLSKRQTSQDFGGFASPTVQGFIDPPSSLQHNFVGMQKGIQGDQNSCYLDTTLFSMFAYNSMFDPLLRRTQAQDDLQLYEEVQKILRESIVNPLRKNGFVRADRILQLREHLDHLGTTKGLMNEEKDPEEFLHTLLSEVFKSKPLLKIRHERNKVVDESNIYQIFLDKDESFTLPTVEQLLLQSFQEHDLKLVEAPSCMIVQMPRFGKDYKMYNRILPSLHLDVTNIIEGYPRRCIVCGNLAVLECSSCKSEEAVAETTHIKNYCSDCYNMMHSQTLRPNHKPTDLLIPDLFLKEFYSKSMTSGFTEAEVDRHRQVLLTPKLMDLFAVICIRTSHYVAFVKAGRETDSEWVFFDSMADRQGDQQGYNIPQITHLKDFRSWVDKKHIAGIVESKQLTELMERLLGDAYICMYADTETKRSTYV